MEEKRIRASALLSAGLIKKHISQMLDISLSTVKRVEKRMKNKESLKDRPRSGRPRAIDPAIVKTAFLKNPTMKMSELAKKKKISKSTVASLMMLGVIVSTGNKMPPVWFKTGYRLKGEDYKEILKTKVLPWIKKIAKKRNYRYVFQQDGAPAHTSKIIQSWMSSNMNFWKKDFWPPQSLDLNPLDYSIWAYIQSKACKTRHTNTEELKRSVNRAWTQMNKTYVQEVCKSFRKRLCQVIEKNGSHIE